MMPASLLEIANNRLMDLESASQCKMAVNHQPDHVASLHLRCSYLANVSFKCDVVQKIFGEVKAIRKNPHAAAQNAKFNHFITEAVSTGDSEISEVGFGDLHFGREPVVSGAHRSIQPRVSTCIHGDHRLKTCFETERRVGLDIWSLLRHGRSVILGFRRLLRHRQ